MVFKTLFSDLILIVKLPNCARNTFKASVVLLTLLLIAISQGLNIAIPTEKNAYELQLIVQKELNKEFKTVQELPCKLSMKTYKECKLAQYQHDSSQKGIKFLTTLKNIIYTLLFPLILLSFISFCFKLKDSKK